MSQVFRQTQQWSSEMKFLHTAEEASGKLQSESAYQGYPGHGQFGGYPDFLVRAYRFSELGA